MTVPPVTIPDWSTDPQAALASAMTAAATTAAGASTDPTLQVTVLGVVSQLIAALGPIAGGLVGTELGSPALGAALGQTLANLADGLIAQHQQALGTVNTAQQQLITQAASSTSAAILAKLTPTPLPNQTAKK